MKRGMYRKKRGTKHMAPPGMRRKKKKPPETTRRKKYGSANMDRGEFINKAEDAMGDTEF